MRKKARRTTEVVVDIMCDICGQSVVPEFQKKNLDRLDEFSSFARLTADFGYGSKHDGEVSSFDFCEDCFDKLRVKINELKSG
ncbi:hypothetical protein [Idiomarina sp. UBA4520]|uniref:hypothetical protein n=1 Tax=Idiomarina sp. UBA4520 TaxID=1946647 RepID=UPI000C60BA3E|nr:MULTISPECIES: hypothetical protein [unclassified Idiomarina]MBF38328.1 hypothetical protein [Idiomarinaceae bacterium]|tara:strand:- start:1174 stop:1422 length:249 start_codon:yes stop_codon:yes gene_type:complete